MSRMPTSIDEKEKKKQIVGNYTQARSIVLYTRVAALYFTMHRITRT